MPSKSIAQQHLMQAAEHGADFPMAKKLRKTMTHDQLHDFSIGSEQDKPEHVIKGDHHSVVSSNTQVFKNKGLSEVDAMKAALHVSKHKNLGKYLHKRKDGKPHGST